LWQQKLDERTRNKENGHPKTIKHIKKKLIRDRGAQCQRCKLTEWLGVPIELTIDHIDGNTTNNNYANLLILCWNCHAQTPTFAGKNIKNKLNLEKGITRSQNKITAQGISVS